MVDSIQTEPSEVAEPKTHEVRAGEDHFWVRADSVRILEREKFMGLLRLERARSDRRGSTLAVLAYSEPGSGDKLETIAAGLTQRVRNTDAIGWLGERELGVLLLEVDLAQARRLAVELVRGLSDAREPVHCVVYPHPPLHWSEGRALGEGVREPSAVQRTKTRQP